MPIDMFEHRVMDMPPCPRCTTVERRTVGWIRETDRYDCATCGANIPVDKRLLNGMAEAQASIAQLNRDVAEIENLLK